MPKRRKSKLKSLPERHCKKPKLTINLRENRKSINYDEAIEISSEDSNDKKEDKQIENIDNSSNSDVVILDQLKPSLFESMKLTFQDEPLVDVISSSVTNDTQDSSACNVIDNNISLATGILNSSRSNRRKSKTPSLEGSAISLSSYGSTSTRNERKKKKSVISEEIFYVEKILDMKIENGKRIFFLKWEGFPDSENSWEPEENIESNAMVLEFLKNVEKIRDVEASPKKIVLEPNMQSNNQSITDDKNINSKVEIEKIKETNNENPVIETSSENINDPGVQVLCNSEISEKENNVVNEPAIIAQFEDVCISPVFLNKQIDEETNNTSLNKECENIVSENQDNDLEKQNLSINEENKSSFAKTENKIDDNNKVNEENKIDEENKINEENKIDEENKINEENKIDEENKINEENKIDGEIKISDENKISEGNKDEITSQKSEIPLIVLRNKSKKRKKRKRGWKKVEKVKEVNNKPAINSENKEQELIPVEADEIFPVVSQRTRKNMKSLKEILDSSDVSDVGAHDNIEFDKSDGRESDSSEVSNKSNNNTNSIASKDPNSFFPTNLPQTVQEIFMVEKILKMKIMNGVRKFFLKWEGFPDSENTWEPEENLECPELIKEFLAEQRRNKNARKRKRLSSADSLALEELPVEVRIKEPVIKPKGFPRSREPDCILAAGMMNDQLMFLIKWKNVDMANLVSARRANIECPQAVISFYENHLNWFNTDHLKFSSVPQENLADEIEEEPKQNKANVKKSSGNLKNSMDGLISLLDDFQDKSTVQNSVNVPKVHPKPMKTIRNTNLQPRRGRPLTKLFNHSLTPKKSATGSSSHSMMNLIRNFKNPKIPPQTSTSLTNDLPTRPLPPPTPLENLSRVYDSREIPKEPSPPPKFEPPKPISQVPILRPINSYRPDFNPRRFGLLARQQTSVSQLPQNIMPQKISMPSITPTLSMPALKPCPNVTILPKNYQISNYNYISVDDNIKLINGATPQQSSNPLSHYLKVVDSITNEFPVPQSAIQQIITQDQKPQLSYQSISDSPINNFIQSNNNSNNNSNNINNNNNNNGFLNPINQMRSMAVSMDQQLRSNQLDGANNFQQNYNNIQTANNNNNNNNNNNRCNNNTRMQLASALQSRYQVNTAIANHPNIIQPSNQVNIYPSQGVVGNGGGNQLSLPQYQFVIHQPQSYTNHANLIQPQSQQQQQQQQQQQSFFAMSPSQVPTGSTHYIIPSADGYSMQIAGVAGVNQQHILPSPQNQYQHNISPQNPELQNSYFKYGTFL